jgi:hypothetical protein
MVCFLGYGPFASPLFVSPHFPPRHNRCQLSRRLASRSTVVMSRGGANARCYLQGSAVFSLFKPPTFLICFGGSMGALQIGAAAEGSALAPELRHIRRIVLVEGKKRLLESLRRVRDPPHCAPRAGNGLRSGPGCCVPHVPQPRSALNQNEPRCQAVGLGSERIVRRASVRPLQADYHVSPNGLISTLNDHAERGWFATCQASSAIAAGAIKK